MSLVLVTIMLPCSSLAGVLVTSLLDNKTLASLHSRRHNSGQGSSVLNPGTVTATASAELYQVLDKQPSSQLPPSLQLEQSGG
jgi:hypothetical protein